MAEQINTQAPATAELTAEQLEALLKRIEDGETVSIQTKDEVQGETLH
jgi:ribosome assembly protein YihI (activator of Der GTPase)